jgi:Mrp family chromosome partitioning ATPase
MDLEEIKRILIPHLSGQLERALPILFTGAGFSLSAKNIRGQTVPSVEQLKKVLWELCFPSDAFESNSSLPHLYEHALIRHKKNLSDLMTSHLTIDADSLPEWYRTIFSMPWAKVYTLNVDDLANAIARNFELPREVLTISATTGNAEHTTPEPISKVLDVVHLNGAIFDIPDNVTFSVTQYGERLSRFDPWYVRLTAELLSRSFVFIGTQLDEPPLWQHLELRRGRGSDGARHLRELRPRSYLVTPSLDRARQALLTEFNVVWVPMTGEQFTREILDKISPAAQKGLERLSVLGSAVKSEALELPDVAKLATNPTQGTEYLVGQEPIWADLQSGRAIERENDETVWRGITAGLKKSGCKGVVIISGTAGSGKSTALMRICLRLVAEGTKVGWLDRLSDISPRDVRACMRKDDAPKVVAFDDADLYGASLSSLVRDIVTDDQYPLVVVAVRAGKLDRVLNPVVLSGLPIAEFSIPNLTDRDITGLLEVLDKANRLGILKSKPRDEQRQAFRDYAGRQLLVAMLQATSGGRFQEKILGELADLEAEAKTIYSFVAVSTAFRLGLSKDEILIATGNASNKLLNTVDQLISRHVLVATPDGSIWARHRVIAEFLLEELQKTGQLADVLSGLALVAATKVTPYSEKSARPWRLLRSILNHDFLIRTIGKESARNLFGEMEPLLAFDSHFWLQRGSLEVEFGDLGLAENFLNQAYSLAPDDPFVQNEHAYLLFRKAIDNPGGPSAQAYVDEATRLLEDLMTQSDRSGPYPYHVFGSQGLSWARRGIKSPMDRERYLRKIIRRVEQGQKKYPQEADLQQLLEDLKKEYLTTAVSST